MFVFIRVVIGYGLESLLHAVALPLVVLRHAELVLRHAKLVLCHAVDSIDDHCPNGCVSIYCIPQTQPYLWLQSCSQTFYLFGHNLAITPFDMLDEFYYS